MKNPDYDKEQASVTMTSVSDRQASETSNQTFCRL